jgi:hypothetical protein
MAHELEDLDVPSPHRSAIVLLVDVDRLDVPRLTALHVA